MLLIWVLLLETHHRLNTVLLSFTISTLLALVTSLGEAGALVGWYIYLSVKGNETVDRVVRERPKPHLIKLPCTILTNNLR